MQETYCHWSASLGELEATHTQVWGTKHYTWRDARDKPTVFFGMYDLRDYVALFNHKGEAWVLWAGSDILNLKNKFLFNDGKLRLLSKIFKSWFHWLVMAALNDAEHWVENDIESEALRSAGLTVAGVCPSFLGDINKFKVIWRPGNKVFSSVSGDRSEEYGVNTIERIAPSLPWIKFNIFGVDGENKENIVYWGRIPKEKMNEEIADMQIGLRLNEFDGFSEILAKAVLQGQYCIGKVKHPYIADYANDLDLISLLNKLRKREEPNIAVRNEYRELLNQYPWNVKINKEKH